MAMVRHGQDAACMGRSQTDRPCMSQSGVHDCHACRRPVPVAGSHVPCSNMYTVLAITTMNTSVYKDTTPNELAAFLKTAAIKATPSLNSFILGELLQGRAGTHAEARATCGRCGMGHTWFRKGVGDVVAEEKSDGCGMKAKAIDRGGGA